MSCHRLLNTSWQISPLPDSSSRNVLLFPVICALDRYNRLNTVLSSNERQERCGEMGAALHSIREWTSVLSTNPALSAAAVWAGARVVLDKGKGRIPFAGNYMESGHLLLAALAEKGANVKQDVGLLGSDTQLAQKLIQKLRMYPFILIFCYSLATINRIYDFINPDHMNFWLTFCAAVVMSLCGLLNAVVYGFTDTVRTRIKHWLQGRPMQDISVTGSINSEAAV